MRLESIQLKNFGPYADVELDLRQVSSATVCGANGAGKSTLVSDGVLWCLFGECRAETDAFIRLGTTEMSATVIFTANGQRYRATRTRSVKTKRGKSDFQVTVHSGEAWQPVERSLAAILNAEYDVVTASNFITQDDPFDLCKAKPSQRIGLLSDILDIAKYTDDAKRAVRQGNLAEGELTSLVGQLEEKRQAVARYQQAMTDREAAMKEMAVIQADLAAAQAAIETNVKQMATIEATLQAMPLEDVGSLELPVAMHRTAKERLEAKIAELKGLAEREAGLLAKQAEFAAVVKKQEELRTERQAHQDDLERKDHAIIQAQEAATAFNQQLAELSKQRAGLAIEMTNLKSRVAEALRWVKEYALETERLKAEIKKAEAQIGLLATVPCGEALQRQCGFTKAAVTTKEERIPALQAQLAERVQGHDAMLALAPHDWQALQTLIADKEQADKDLADKEAALQQESTAHNLQQPREARRLAAERLKAIEAQITRYEHHQAAIQAALADLPKVQHAKEALPGVQHDLEARIQDLNAAQQALDHARTHATRKADLERQLATVVLHHEAAKAHEETLQDRKQAVQATLAHAQAMMSQTCDAATALQALEKEVTSRKAAVQEYHWLAEAYKRVPVLMIDNAIPVVEREANLALQQLSARGMTLRFETQKALKTVEKLVDELNIIVRDQAGERPYETYSGGERGLANFATRLGLSALTSTRSGARLETLVIDEAFASLDESVSERMRSFLGTLPEKFPLVIVITHDAGFKGTLGSQIVVSPGPQGSTVEVCA